MAITREQAVTIREYLDSTYHQGRNMKPIIKSIYIAMLGNIGVGKNSIMARLNGFEPPICDPHRGEMSFRWVPRVEDRLVVFEGENNIGDLARSPEDYGPGTISDYSGVRRCEACIFVYDVTNRASFEALQRHHRNFYVERSLERPTLWGLIGSEALPRPPFRGLFFVIANKIDCDRNDWTVSIQEGEDFSAPIGAVFLQMSAKTGEGAGKDVLVDIACHILLQKIWNASEDRNQEEAERRAPGPLDSMLPSPFCSDMRQRLDGKQVELPYQIEKHHGLGKRVRNVAGLLGRSLVTKT